MEMKQTNKQGHIKLNSSYMTLRNSLIELGQVFFGPERHHKF